MTITCVTPETWPNYDVNTQGQRSLNILISVVEVDETFSKCFCPSYGEVVAFYTLTDAHRFIDCNLEEIKKDCELISGHLIDVEIILAYIYWGSYTLTQVYIRQKKKFVQLEASIGKHEKMKMLFP